jgi:hypothetical protein
LSRPPNDGGGHDRTPLIVDSAEQIRALADLLARGLLTRDEFERHKDKVLWS